jgi:hypothetical protein
MFGVAELDHFRAFVAERDVPCPSCGYSLRGLLEPRCPECGEGLRLGVQMEEPRLGRLLAVLIPLIAGLGFGGIVTMWGLTAGASGDELTPLALLVFIAIPAAACAVQFRRRLRRVETATYLLLLAAAWGVPTALVWWFMATVA